MINAKITFVCVVVSIIVLGCSIQPPNGYEIAAWASYVGVSGWALIATAERAFGRKTAK